jgi:hypothetical protein
MRYREAFDYLTDFALPRRKYAPKHWLVPLYFFGVRVGWQVKRALTRTPLSILARGIRDGWGDD